MRKTAIFTAVLVLGAGLLAGCGGGGGHKSDKSNSGNNASSSHGYCQDLKKAAKDLAALGGASLPTADQFNQFTQYVDTLAGEAPSAVSDDWKVLQTQLKKLTDALSEAGITLQQAIEAGTTGKLPPGMTQQDFVALGQKLQDFAGSQVTQATEAIRTHAKDACHVSLSGS